MATTSNMAVNDFVYKPFEPNNPGVVLANEIVDDLHHRVTVKWLKGGTTTDIVIMRGYNDFDALIEDHRKKLEWHENRKNQLLIS